MGGPREEDRKMKIPALIHLTRLGYRYLPREAGGREPETNLITEACRGALAEINGKEIADGEWQGLREALRAAAAREDNGQAFHRMLLSGWEGWRLIDFDHPERNRFHAGTEISFGRGKERFQPDLTVFVNGLPLAMIEVKTREKPNGIRMEYDRARERYQNQNLRPYLRMAQVMVFSNGGETEEDALMPQDGVFYAAVSEGEFPLRAFREESPSVFRRVGRKNRETETRILEDNRMAKADRGSEWRRLTAGSTATHRALTSLFLPERLLFLIRYGIRFETEEAGRVRREALRSEQLFALARLRSKRARGFRNWTLACFQSGGRVPLAASAFFLIRDLLKNENVASRFYWVCDSRESAAEAAKAFGRYGIRAGEKDAEIRMISAREKRIPFQGQEESGFSGQRILFWGEAEPAYEPGRSFASLIRGADRKAVQIRFSGEQAREGGNYTYLLECADGSLYCGWTNDLERRVQAHNAGRGAKYTRSRRPVRLVYWEEMPTARMAMSREARIKRMTRKDKEKRIAASAGGKGRKK